MKDKTKYTILIFAFVMLVCVVTITHLFIHYEKDGSVLVNKKYYDIVYSNLNIDYDTSMSVKTNEDNDTIKVNIPNLNEFKKSESFSLDVKNIGNIDASISEANIMNIDTNVPKSKVKVDVSLLESNVIKGSESKKLNVTITYLGDNTILNPYYNFVIKYVFDEVNL